MLLDGYLLYRMFDSDVFPATAAWPPGAAAAEAISAGDEGGRKAAVLGVGVVVGIAGQLADRPGVPMSAFGVAFIGNIWALTMFGIGLLLRGYSSELFFGPFFPRWSATSHKALCAARHHGRRRLVALVQVAFIILRRGPFAPMHRSATRRRRCPPLARPGNRDYVLIAVGDRACWVD